MKINVPQKENSHGMSTQPTLGAGMSMTPPPAVGQQSLGAGMSMAPPPPAVSQQSLGVGMSMTPPPAVGNSTTQVPSGVTLQKKQGVSLAKGQAANIGAFTNNLSNIKVCIQWDLHPSMTQDLDLSCFMCDMSGHIIGNQYFVFYGNTASGDQSLQHLGDNRTGAGDGDDEIIVANLTQVDPRAQRLFFVLTMDQVKQNGLNFGLVKNALVRIVDGTTDEELLRYEPTSINPNATALIICELFKQGNQWGMNPIGEGLMNTDLADLCGRYGVSVI